MAELIDNIQTEVAKKCRNEDTLKAISDNIDPVLAMAKKHVGDIKGETATAFGGLKDVIPKVLSTDSLKQATGLVDMVALFAPLAGTPGVVVSCVAAIISGILGGLQVATGENPLSKKIENMFMQYREEDTTISIAGIHNLFKEFQYSLNTISNNISRRRREEEEEAEKQKKQRSREAEKAEKQRSREAEKRKKDEEADIDTLRAEIYNVSGVEALGKVAQSMKLQASKITEVHQAKNLLTVVETFCYLYLFRAMLMRQKNALCIQFKLGGHANTAMSKATLCVGAERRTDLKFVVYPKTPKGALLTSVYISNPDKWPIIKLFLDLICMEETYYPYPVDQAVKLKKWPKSSDHFCKVKCVDSLHDRRLKAKYLETTKGKSPAKLHFKRTSSGWTIGPSKDESSSLMAMDNEKRDFSQYLTESVPDFVFVPSYFELIQTQDGKQLMSCQQFPGEFYYISNESPTAGYLCKKLGDPGDEGYWDIETKRGKPDPGYKCSKPPLPVYVDAKHIEGFSYLGD